MKKPPPKRKIVQVAVSESEETCGRIVALCNDGSVWTHPLYPPYSNFDYRWTRLHDIPQGSR